MSHAFRAPACPTGRGRANESIVAAAVIATLAVHAPAQPQFEELVRRALPATNLGTRGVAVGDVDLDGDLDVVFGNRGFQNRLYLNDGAGGYRDATEGRLPAADDETFAVALGDVDGDGDLDLALANGDDYYGKQNRLYLNDGSGVYTDATAERLPTDADHSLAVAFGDVDGDGDLDLLFAAWGRTVYLAGQNRLYLNDGTGTFADATATHLPVDRDRTTAVVFGDVDADGDLDVVLASYGYPRTTNRLYRNDGAGVFTDVSAAQLPVDNDRTTSIALGDVDGDGDLDIFFGNAGPFAGAQNRLYLNDGSGTYADATAARLPGDGDRTMAVALADVDADGDVDLILGNAGGAAVPAQNRLYLNDGAGTYVDATAARLPVDEDGCYALAPADVDGDGDPDALFGNTASPSRLCLNDGGGRFREARTGGLPPDRDSTYAVALGDVDGDSDPDLVLGSYLGQSRLYVNDGRGGYTDETPARLPLRSDRTWAVALGDVDGDADLDLVLGNDGSGPNELNRLYLNDGSGAFVDVTTGRLPAEAFERTRALALGDVDGDGDLDLVVANSGFYAGQQNRLFVNDGSGRFANRTTMRLPADSDRSTAVVLADVDGDGDLDLVFGNRGQNRLYRNDGGGTFADATPGRLPAELDATTSVAAGDVDGDGDADLVFGNDGEQDRLYLNDGTGTFANRTGLLMPVDRAKTTAVVLGDVDFDGDLDLVLASYDVLLGQQNRLYVNDGSGRYADVTGVRLPADPDDTRAAVLGDVDGDGDLDLVFGNSGQSRLQLNLLRQLHAPLTLAGGRPYRLDVYARYGPPGLVSAVPFVAASPAAIPIPPLGVLGLDPARMVALPAVAVAPATGVGTVGFLAPRAPSLAGLTLYAQALVLHGGQARLTNATADVLR